MGKKMGFAKKLLLKKMIGTGNKMLDKIDKNWDKLTDKDFDNMEKVMEDRIKRISEMFAIRIDGNRITTKEDLKKYDVTDKLEIFEEMLDQLGKMLSMSEKELEEIEIEEEELEEVMEEENENNTNTKQNRTEMDTIGMEQNRSK